MIFLFIFLAEVTLTEIKFGIQIYHNDIKVKFDLGTIEHFLPLRHNFRI